MSWADDWPRMAPVELAPRDGIEETVFDFADASALDDPGWLAVRTAPTDVASMTARPGSLAIAGERSTLNAPRPQFIGRRQRHLTATVSTRVNASAGAGGMAARYDEEHHISIEAHGQGEATVVTARAKVARIEQTWRATLPAGEVTLRMGMAPPPTGFSPDAMGGDRIRLLAVAGQDEVLLAELDGRYWTAETTASSTGRVITCTPVREW